MEYTKKCNVCGKVFCFTDEDVKKNALNKGLAALSSLGALASLGGGTIFHTHHLQGQADRYTDGVVDFDQCPYCHSRNVSFCTDEEAASLERKASAPAISINSGASTESLLKRAFMFLEDGDWASAEAYSEACLDKDPELAEAYLAKLMAELKVKARSVLKDQPESFEDKSNYQKALRFADEQLRAELTQYITHINTRNENSRKDDIYCRASNIIEAANTESECQEAAQLFASISGWKDADAQLSVCSNKISELQAKAEADRRERERQDEVARKENEKRVKRNKKIAIIAAPIVCAIIAVFIVLKTVIVPNNQYNNAVALMNEEKYDDALAVLLALGNYKDAASLRFDAWQEVAVRDTICAGVTHTVCLKSDGTVVTVGDNDFGERNVSRWTDIVAISANDYYTIGLKSGGTVVAAGLSAANERDVSRWTDIVAISAGSFHTVGLKSDGTVVAVGNNEYEQCDVSRWTDIVAISAGSRHTVGLKSDGTVVATGDNEYGQCDVSGWADIVAICADGSNCTIGLKSDGTVVAKGLNNYGQCNLRSWTDIVAIYPGGAHTVGLKSDGTLIATGYNNDGQCDVGGWVDIKLP